MQIHENVDRMFERCFVRGQRETIERLALDQRELREAHVHQAQQTALGAATASGPSNADVTPTLREHTDATASNII